MSHLVRTLVTTVATLAAVTAAGPSVAATPLPTSWDLAAEFQPTANTVNQRWSYGQKLAGCTLNCFALLPAVINPYLGTGGNGVWGWSNPSNAVPWVAQNRDFLPTNFGPLAPVMTLVPRGMVLHAGVACEKAVVRFKPPDAGVYRVSGQFHGLDANGWGVHTKTDIVRVLASGAQAMVHSGAVAVTPNQLGYNPANQSNFTSKVVSLYPGERLDFEVGCLAGYGYSFGATGLHAVVQRIGEIVPID